MPGEKLPITSEAITPQKVNDNTEKFNKPPEYFQIGLPLKLTVDDIFMNGTNSLTPFGSDIQSILIRQSVLNEDSLSVDGHGDDGRESGEIFTRGFNKQDNSNGNNSKKVVGPTEKRREELDIEISQICEGLGILRQDGTIQELARQFGEIVKQRVKFNP